MTEHKPVEPKEQAAHPVKHGGGDIDRIEARFDDPTLISDAGPILIATLANRRDLEGLIDSTVRLLGRVGGFRPGRK